MGLTLAAASLTSTSSGPGCGTGMSSNRRTSGPPCAWIRSARMSAADRRQPGGERRKGDDEPDQREHAEDERQGRDVDVAHGGARRRNALHHEKEQPERRRGVADLEREQHDEAEPG